MSEVTRESNPELFGAPPSRPRADLERDRFGQLLTINALLGLTDLPSQLPLLPSMLAQPNSVVAKHYTPMATKASTAINDFITTAPWLGKKIKSLQDQRTVLEGEAYPATSMAAGIAAPDLNLAGKASKISKAGIPLIAALGGHKMMTFLKQGESAGSYSQVMGDLLKRIKPAIRVKDELKRKELGLADNEIGFVADESMPGVGGAFESHPELYKRHLQEGFGGVHYNSSEAYPQMDTGFVLGDESGNEFFTRFGDTSKTAVARGVPQESFALQRAAQSPYRIALATKDHLKSIGQTGSPEFIRLNRALNTREEGVKLIERALKPTKGNWQGEYRVDWLPANSIPYVRLKNGGYLFGASHADAMEHSYYGIDRIIDEKLLAESGFLQEINGVPTFVKR